MGEVIAVLSGKGGTGKTSLCANVAVSLCALGERVLLVDADAGLRNLDIVLGMTDKLLFTYADVISGSASLKEASVPHPVVKNLRVLTAPGSLGPIPHKENLSIFLNRCREHFTFTVVDCPAGIGEDVLAFGSLACRALVVATPDRTSMRSAQAAVMALQGLGQQECRIVVNRLRRSMTNKGDALGIDEAIDAAGLQLLGAVPEDSNIIACGNRGEVLLLHAVSPSVAAYMNIAKRLRGQRVPLFQGVKGI